MSDIYTNSAGKRHTTREADDTAHKALELAEKLEKKINKGLMDGILEQKEENLSWFGLIFSGIVVISMLGTATGRMYENANKMATIGGIWEIFGEMVAATVFLGFFLLAAINHMTLGNYIVYLALFFAVTAFGFAIFMNMVAIRSRILKQ